MSLEPQLLESITPDDRDALCEVAYFLRKAERAWSRIGPATQCELNAMHHDEGSLALCLRWAGQAADELIEVTREADRPARD